MVTVMEQDPGFIDGPIPADWVGFSLSGQTPGSSGCAVDNSFISEVGNELGPFPGQ